MTLVRIDNRLIHGQIIETWLPSPGAKTVIVADDALAADALQQEIMSLAIPQSVACLFVTIEGLAREMGGLVKDRESSVLVLFSCCPDAKRAHEAGFGFTNLNVGNVHYGPGKRQVSPSVALSTDDEHCLRQLTRRGVTLDFRCVPNDSAQARF